MQWIKLSCNRLLGFYSRQSLIILLLVLFIPNTGCQPQDKKRNPAPIRPSTVTIIAPEKLPAGTEDALILVSASDVPDNSPVTLVALNSHGPYRQRSLIRQGQALFRLPVAVTRSAGQLDLIATVGLGQAETQLQIAANEPVDPILVLVGPRSIIANGQDSTMVVAFPVDRWGNPIQDNTAVRIHARHPDQAISNKLGRQTTLTTYTQHLLAWTKLRSGLFSGRTAIGVTSRFAHGSEQAVIEVPGEPQTFGLTTDFLTLPADGRQRLTIKTDPILDHYGNPILDGTLINFLIRDEQGERSVIPAETINGQAEAQITAPTQAMTMTIQADLSGVISTPLIYTFVENSSPGTILSQTLITTDTIEITAGPIIGKLQHFVPDGSLVLFQVYSPEGKVSQYQTPTYRGYSTLNLRREELSSGQYLITIDTGDTQGNTLVEIP